MNYADTAPEKAKARAVSEVGSLNKNNSFISIKSTNILRGKIHDRNEKFSHTYDAQNFQLKHEL